MVRQKDGWPDQTVPSVVAFPKWPKMVLGFLESRINIQTRPANALNNGVNAISELRELESQPISIDCKNLQKSCHKIQVLFINFPLTFTAFTNQQKSNSKFGDKTFITRVKPLREKCIIIFMFFDRCDKHFGPNVLLVCLATRRQICVVR